MGDLDIPTSNIKLDTLWGTKEFKEIFDKTCCTWGYQDAQEILTRI